MQKANELKCKQCEKEFETEIGLKGHYNRKHGGRKSETVNLEYEKEKLKKEIDILTDKLTHSEEIREGLFCTLLNNSVKLDTTCSDCDKDFYYMTVLNRHTQLYAWACASCGECFKTKEEDCCYQECKGALHRFKK